MGIDGYFLLAITLQFCSLAGLDPDHVVTSSEVAALLVFDQPFVGSKLYYYDYRVRQNRSCIFDGIELILLLSDLKDVVKPVWNYLCSCSGPNLCKYKGLRVDIIFMLINS